MKSLPTPASAASWEAQNNLVIEQNFRQLEESLRAGYQPLDATLTAWAAVVGAANKLPYFTAVDAFALTDFTADARLLLADADVPRIGTVNTWTLRQTFAAGPFVTGSVGAGPYPASSVSLDQTSAAGAGRIAAFGQDAATIGQLRVDCFSSDASLGGQVGLFTSTGLNGCALGASTPAAATVTTLGITQGAVISGTYTPTITGVTNVTSSTATALQYLRVGSVVNVSGAVGLTPTGAGTMTARVSLPVASDFTLSTQLGGACVAWNSGLPIVATFNADATNNEAQIRVENSAGVGLTLSFTFQYVIV